VVAVARLVLDWYQVVCCFSSPALSAALMVRHRVQVDSTGKLKGSAVTAIAQRSGSSTAIEASTIYQYGSYYYLFTSWDKCCDGAHPGISTCACPR
jgi:beta-xylosidase